jgi:uncharacterized membrane protein
MTRRPCVNDASPETNDPCVEEIARRNIEAVEQIEQDNAKERGIGERIADRVTRFCGTMTFAALHILWFGAWIALNSLPGFHHWDEYPFSFLTLTVSLEAIFLTIFILISQNRQSELSDQRNKLDLQINLLSEQENSKMMAMLEAIMERLGIEQDDPEIPAMVTPIHPDKIIEQIKEMADKAR